MAESLDLNVSSAVKLINDFPDNSNNELDIDAVTNAFRYLRNVCGTNPDSQDEIINDKNILSSTNKILLDIVTSEPENEKKILCLQVGLQFLGNLSVGNKNNQQKIWTTSLKLLETCLKINNPKVQNFSAMILYNIFLGNPELLNNLEHTFEDLYELTLNESSSEFAIFILELFVLKSNYMIKFYDEIKPQSKLIILEIVNSLIAEQSNKLIQTELIQFFSKQFMKKSDLILKTSETYANSLDPVEVVKLLDLLVAFSSDDEHGYLEIIQQEKSLLINCIELFKNIHSVSKQNENNFSMVNKISEIENEDKLNSIQENPTFGFKCSLIQLIGNLCWKNKTNQDQVRELDCIPVILDCCNIDARNPFILQWSIFTIHNLCKENLENQKVIASLSKEGKIDSARLAELGITLNVDDKGQPLCIVPLQK